MNLKAYDLNVDTLDVHAVSDPQKYVGIVWKSDATYVCTVSVLFSYTFLSKKVDFFSSSWVLSYVPVLKQFLL